MPRAPFQVLVYPYRRNDTGQLEYALLRRSDLGFWQGIAGGGEEGEIPLETARREAFEEAGIPPTSDYMRLDTMVSVPATEFKDRHVWGDHIYVIPQYCFGVDAQDIQLTISREHTEFQWLVYPEAYELIKYDGNKTALWELDKRLQGMGPRP